MHTELIKISLRNWSRFFFTSRILDDSFDSLISKHSANLSFRKPKYLNICLQRDTNIDELSQRIQTSFGIDENTEHFQFGIVGLHPCGDLASILTNCFLKCPQAKFLNLVGCCYMKLTCDQQNELYERKVDKCDFIGYPLGDFMRREMLTSAHLSYESREIACHAIEKYTERLILHNYDELRVHSFRAAIEKIIVKHWPEKRHSGLRSIKWLTTFEDYCRRAVENTDIVIPSEDICSTETIENLRNWKNVVIFYSLRLMLAPLVESIILYDRLLWLKEKSKSKLGVVTLENILILIYFHRLWCKDSTDFRSKSIIEKSYNNCSQIKCLSTCLVQMQN